MRERGPVRPARPVPPRQRSVAGPLVFVLLVLALIVVLVGQGQALVADAVVGWVDQRDTLLRQGPIRAIVGSRVGAATDLSADPNGSAREFEIRTGETAADIAHRLEQDGLVRSALAFLVVVYDEGREDSMQAGRHTVSPAMTPREISAVLVQTGQEQQITLRIIEGWRLTETAEAVAKAFPRITKEQFLQAAVVGKRNAAALAGLDPTTPLEGFLYPDTYFFKTDATAESIVAKLLDTFDSKAVNTLRAAAAARKTTVADLVKLASLVEREARDRSESARIAGVYANRLALGMKLDADPTIQYALGAWRELTTDDLKIDSPYNTYRVAGLPPTPICGPGLAALEGAAAPEKHDFLYFVADPATGKHLFAKTLEEQEANRLKVGNR